MSIRPEDVGLSSDRLARIAPHLLQSYIDPKKISGAITLIARRGEIAYFSPVGMMDLEREKPMAEDTIVRIYSMTKPITSVALMMLYEKGLFALHDPVEKFIPEWRNLRVFASGNLPDFLTVPPSRPMNNQDLFTHTSGLTYGFMERTNVDAAYRKCEIGTGTLKKMIDDLAGLPLEFSPGTHWNYSVATDVLGYLVEVISGMPFDEYLRTQILGPLKMVDTGFDVPPEKVERFAANYTRRPDKTLMLMDDPEKSLYTKKTTFFSGGGGLVSTASDYYRFCQMMLNGGVLDGVRILGRKTAEFMTMNHLPEDRDMASMTTSTFTQIENPGVGFGLGFAVNIDIPASGVVGSVGEHSWGGAASTAFWIDPMEDLIVIFLTQFMPDGTFNFRGQLKSIIASALID
ncbi:MAG: serine hydrolase domain-containing protein [Desulfobacterales bacterium]